MPERIGQRVGAGELELDDPRCGRGRQHGGLQLVEHFPDDGPVARRCRDQERVGALVGFDPQVRPGGMPAAAR